MQNIIHSVIGSGFVQVCIVVNSVDDSIKKMWDEFRIGPWNVAVVGADTITDVLYHGRPGGFGMKTGFAQVNGFELELIEPTEGESVYKDFLKENGEGVHHMACPGIKSLDVFEQTIKDMEEAGYPCIMRGHCLPGYFAYFDTTAVLKTNLEICCQDPEGITPPFDYTYPEK